MVVSGVGVTVWTRTGGRSADSVEEGLEQFAEARAELSQSAPPVPWETPLRFMDGWGAGAQHPVDGIVLNGSLDSASVDGLDGVLVIRFLHDPVG